MQRSCCISLKTLTQSYSYPEYIKIQAQQTWRLAHLLWKLISKDGLNRESSWLKTILTALSLARLLLMVCNLHVALLSRFTLNHVKWAADFLFTPSFQWAWFLLCKVIGMVACNDMLSVVLILMLESLIHLQI